MSNKATIRALLILFALFLSVTAQPQTITGKVVGVSDGDTITVLDEQKRQHFSTFTSCWWKRAAWSSTWAKTTIRCPARGRLQWIGLLWTRCATLKESVE